ncbi:MAG: CBS domain-containing protein [Pirellulales bacterium]|nr:CBS domain-containing protein [Pirellulales bacterium]
MNETLVRDIMIPLEEYPCVPDTFTLRDAILGIQVQIQREELSTVPRVVLVFNENHSKLLGMLRRRDIMRGLEPRFMVRGPIGTRRMPYNVKIDPNLSEFSYDKAMLGIRRRADRKIKDFMIPIKATINDNDHIMKAVCEMVDKNTSLLPVMKDDDVVGVLRSVDVLNELARPLGF